MYIIVGLGNPDRKYDNTRHNTGYVTIDRIADRYGIDILERKFKSVIGKGVIDGERVVLVKPLTYMNLSGEAVREVADYFKVDPQTQICIIYDDTSMEVGKIRIRKKGSAGGHNGIKSIISHLGSDVFVRVKIGIGEKPPRMDLADYVLGHFASDDKKIIEESADRVSEAIPLLVHDMCDEAMNKING